MVVHAPVVGGWRVVWGRAIDYEKNKHANRVISSSELVCVSPRSIGKHRTSSHRHGT